MAQLKPPKSLDFTKAENLWPEWKKRFERYRIASKLFKEAGDIQVNTLLYTLGHESEHIFSQLGLTEEEEKDYELVINKLEEHFTPKRNVIHERAMFHQRNQQNGESAETFIRSLYEMAEHCEFGTTKDDCIRDRLVVGISDKELSKRLQLKEKLNLSETVKIIRQAEAVKIQISSQKDSKSLEEVKREKRPVRRQNNRYETGHNRASHHPDNAQHNRSKNIKCHRCGLNHAPQQCRAKNSKCNRCHKIGHYARCCRLRQVTEVSTAHQNNRDTDSSEEEFFIGTITSISDSHKSWHVKLPINNHLIQFKIDSGADVSIMSVKSYRNMPQPPTLNPANHILKGIDGKLKCRGTFTAHTNYHGKEYEFTIYVTDAESNLLSRAMAEKLNLITLNVQEVSGHTTVGLMKSDPVKIKLKNSAVPFHCSTARRIPIPLKPKVKAELKRMEEAGIIEKVTEPTDWCSPIVVVPKANGAVRICVDLRQLNREVKRERYVLSTLEDMITKLNGAQVFTHLDLTSGYYHLKLHPDSTRLTTFITPFGRYCFRRLPFGISSASEIFQRKMTELLEEVEGVEASQDDILVAGRTMEEHDEKLKKVLNLINEAGLKLNVKKCEWRQPEITFLGHRFSKEGIRPDPEKVRAIVEMPEPTNVTELQRIRGMINYIGVFVPNLATKMKPLNELLKKNTHWSWGPSQKSALESVKQSLVDAKSLTFFDVTKPIVVSADASSYGLGAVLLQEEGELLKPIAFASRTLQPAEVKYAQIEKECLAAVWACEKFDRYLRGLQEFRLLTDHKPLVPLINGPDLNTVPLRCQRLLMKMMRYNPKAQHVPGKQLVIADTLSRHPSTSRSESDIAVTREVNLYVNEVLSSLPASHDRLEEIKKATEADPVLCEAINLTINGWPTHARELPTQLHDLFSIRSHLSVAERLLLYDSRIVIPKVMQNEILEVIHQGHQGVSKCRERANNAVWWFGINAAIKDRVARCAHCQENSPSQRREPLMPSPLPAGPWIKIGADLLYFKGKHFMVVIDYYSRYLELVYLDATTSNTVIAKLKSMFARWGVPETLMSDNGPQFSSEHFANFAKSYGFQHVTSSPHYPQANGLAESAVKRAKEILKQQDPFLALMVYRSTPQSSTKTSPAEIMLNRKMRTTLPMLSKTLEHKVHDEAKIHREHGEAQQRNAYYYNRRHGSKPLPILEEGQTVRVKTEKDSNWSEPAVVLGKADSPRSYIVQTNKGTIRRNRKHLMEIPSETPTEEIPEPEVAESEIPTKANSERDTISVASAGERADTNIVTQSETRTRSGRIVRPPDRLNI